MVSFTRRAMLHGAAALAIGTTLLATGAVAQSSPVTLRMIGSWAPGFSPSADVGHKFMELVNEAGEGKVKIQFIGADDAMPPFDQPEALDNGVFDVWYGAPNYWAGLVPGGDITELSPFETPDGGPGSELHQFMVDLYAPKGVRFIGHAAGKIGVGAHYISTQKPVSSVDDLTGMKLRVAPLTRHFITAAEAEPVTLPPSEIYLAMDRGVVDGFSWPVADAYTRYGWQTVTKYLVDQPMYRSGVSIKMNLDKWESLSPEVQEILSTAMEGTQEWTRGWFAKNLEEQIAGMKAAGMEVLPIGAEESARWTALAESALWSYYESVMDPDSFARAETLLKRAK